MEGVNLRHGSGGIVLKRLICFATLLACPRLAGEIARADESLPSSPSTVRAGVECQNHDAANCLGSLAVTRDGGESNTAIPAASHPSVAPRCHFERDFVYTPSSVIHADGGPERIEVLHRVCPAGAENLGAPYAYMPAAHQPPAANIRGLVEQATKALRLPPPQTSLSPDSASAQIVGLPLWAWTSASEWTPRSASASAGGASLTMTATPAFTVWSMGDGGSFTCRGPGTPYPSTQARQPPVQSPDCGYTYEEPSASRPEGVFPVSATTHWRLVWSATDGSSGEEPDLTSSSRLDVRVSEVQALITNVRS